MRFENSRFPPPEEHAQGEGGERGEVGEVSERPREAKARHGEAERTGIVRRKEEAALADKGRAGEESAERHRQQKCHD